MATIIPFQAWRYNTDRVRMDRVVAPPYDVISPAEQAVLYERDPRNVIKVELGKDEPSDNGSTNKYERAARYLQEWTQEAAIRQDKARGFYLYETDFLDPETNKTRRRLVIFGLIRLEPFETKAVLPHEKTHSGPKEDRFKLLTATKTNFSPVFGLYEDSSHLAQSIHSHYESKNPLFSFELENGERHRLWQIADPDETEGLSRRFESKAILIADGHHRYETALRYANEIRSMVKSDFRPPPQSSPLRGEEIGEGYPSDYCLMGLVELSDEGLLIFPIHRIVKNLARVNQDQFLKELSALFLIEQADEKKLEQIAKGKECGVFGIQFPDRSYLVKLKEPAEARREMPKGKPETWYQLEVAQISYLVLQRLGIGENEVERHLEYTRFFKEAIQSVKTKKADLSFIVPPIPARTMREICAAGELMPQKSTYFYPKLASGILMYRHE